MKNSKNSEPEILDEIKRLFEAVPELPELDEEHQRFLDKRAELEKRHDVWTFQGYLKLNDTLKAYALEDKLMENLEIKIRWAMEDDKEEFLKTKFYRRFRDHDIVAKHNET
jgi:hypothetical protein